MPFTASQKSPFVTSDNISRFDYNDNRPAHNDHATTWRRLHQTWHFFSRRRPGEFSPRFWSIIPAYTCCSPMLDFQTWYHKTMQVAPSDLARELSNHPTVLLASAEFLASTEQSNQSRSRFQKFVNGCNLLLIPPYLLPWYWVTMNRRLDWEIRNAIETNTSVVNWEIHLRYTWYWVTMNRRPDWEIRNAIETNTSVV